MPLISALPVGTVTSSTPFPANVGSTTSQVTLAPVYASLDNKAALVHTHAASDVVSGTMATARLGSGTATSTTFLRGDQTYADPTSVAFFPGSTITPLVQSSWGWVNQGVATVTQGATTVFLRSTAIGTGIKARTVTAPATPYSITTMMRGWYEDTTASFQYAGVTFRDLGGKLFVFYVSSANQLQAVKFTSPTVFSAAPLNEGLVAAGHYLWLRIEDDATDIKFSSSLDGINFVQQYSTARGTFFSTAPGPEQVGIFIATDAGTRAASMSYFSWVTS